MKFVKNKNTDITPTVSIAANGVIHCLQWPGRLKKGRDCLSQ